MYQFWPSLQDEDFLLCLFLAWLGDFKSVSIWVFFQSELCLGEPSKVLLLLPCETSRHASRFNTDRNRLAPLRGVLFGLKLEIFREGMHLNYREQFLPHCVSLVEAWECSENAARSPWCFTTNLLIYSGSFSLCGFLWAALWLFQSALAQSACFSGPFPDDSLWLWNMWRQQIPSLRCTRLGLCPN